MLFRSWGPCFAQAAKRRGLYRRSGFTVDHRHDRADDSRQQGIADYAFIE